MPDYPALLLRAVRQRLSRGADAQPDRRRLAAGLCRLLQGRRDADAEVPRRRQRDGRSAGAGARRQEAHPVRRDPDLPRRAHRQIQAGGRGRAARSAALDHLRQPEGQRLSRAVPLPEEFRQAAGRSGGDGVPEGPHRRQSRHPRQAARRTAVHSRRAADHRRRLALRLSVLSGRGVRLRHRRHPQQHRGLARPHQGAARLEASLRADAGLSAGACRRLRIAAQSTRGQAAVDDEFGAGDEAGFVRQQIDAHVGDLGRGAEPAERNVAGDAGAGGIGKARLLQHQVDHRAFEKGRMHGVAAHLRIEPRAVQRHRLGEQPHAALRGVVGGKVVPADQPRDRRQIDDRAAALLEQRADRACSRETCRRD